MLEESDFQNRSRWVRGTNITVQKLTPSLKNTASSAAAVSGQAASSTAMHIFCSVHEDPSDELKWHEKTLRPERLLVHPSEAFVEGLKKVRPALHFNTFDSAKAKERRVQKQKQDQANAKERRAALVAPTAALKVALNPKRLPPGSSATAAENGLLMRGAKNKRAVEKHVQGMRAKRRGQLKQGGQDDAPSRPKRDPFPSSQKEEGRQRKKPRREKARPGDAL
jgi:hypothetical protein